eukprot:7622118-Pyramimonas_sp.AAC.1
MDRAKVQAITTALTRRAEHAHGSAFAEVASTTSRGTSRNPPARSWPPLLRRPANAARRLPL